MIFCYWFQLMDFIYKFLRKLSAFGLRQAACTASNGNAPRPRKFRKRVSVCFEDVGKVLKASLHGFAFWVIVDIGHHGARLLKRVLALISTVFPIQIIHMKGYRHGSKDSTSP